MSGGEGRRSGPQTPDTPPPEVPEAAPLDVEIVPLAPASAVDVPGRLSKVLLNADRGITFGFLLGYLSLAVHGTLEYPRYARYYVGPWVEPKVRPEVPEVEYWTKRVARHLAYSSEMPIGAMVAVISDGPAEPTWIYERLGDTDPSDPPHRISVRTRLPRVDILLQPEPGFALDLYEFAHEVRVRFDRQLD